jgi:hypothetical protein
MPFGGLMRRGICNVCELRLLEDRSGAGQRKAGSGHGLARLRIVALVVPS